MGQVIRGVLIRNDRVLLMQRAANDYFGLTWEFPGGSTDGQEHRNAMERELLEETGLILINLGICLQQKLFPIEGRPDFTQYTYHIEAHGDVTLSHEHEDFCWHPLGEKFRGTLSPSVTDIFPNI